MYILFKSRRETEMSEADLLNRLKWGVLADSYSWFCFSCGFAAENHIQISLIQKLPTTRLLESPDNKMID